MAIILDDFDGASLDTGKWVAQNSAAGSNSVSSSQITFTSATGSKNYAWIHSVNKLNYPAWIEAKVDSFSGTGATFRLGESTGSILRSDNGNYYNEYSADAVTASYRIVGDNSTIGWEVANSSLNSDTSGIWSFSWPSSNSQKFLVNYNSKITGSNSTISVANYYFYLGNATSASGSSKVDWARARKYASTDPSISSIGTEENYSPTPTPTPLPTAAPTSVPTTTPTPLPTATATSIPTVTETPTSANNSNEVSSTTTPSCTDQQPNGKPKIFQIDSTQTSANIYFTPMQNISGFQIQYGLNTNADDYGVTFPYSNTDGVVSYTVNHLQPNQTYYYKVKGANGCTAGEWSNTFTSTTLMNYFSTYNTMKSSEVLEPTIKPTAEPIIEPTQTIEENVNEITTESTENNKLDIKILSDKNEPLTGVTVTLHSKVQIAVTDENGVAHFENVEKGEHKLIVDYEDYHGEQPSTVDDATFEETINVQIQLKNGLPINIVLIIVSMMILIIIYLLVMLTKKNKKLN